MSLKLFHFSTANRWPLGYASETPVVPHSIVEEKSSGRQYHSQQEP